jgi:hypothetical protein
MAMVRFEAPGAGVEEKLPRTEAPMEDNALGKRLLGSWRLESLRIRMEDTGEVEEPFGHAPRGSLILTPDGRFMTVLNASGRSLDGTEASAVTAFRGMMAYTGIFRLAGDRLTVDVDAAWHPAWEGTQQVRFVELTGERLTITSEVQSHPLHPGRQLRGIMVWVRS